MSPVNTNTMNAGTDSYKWVMTCLLMLMTLFAQAQCFADSSLAFFLRSHSAQRERFAQIEAEAMRLSQLGKIHYREVVSVPVVIHVVYSSEEENISDEQIYSQLAAVNRDFRALNENRFQIPGSFQGLLTDPGIEFCLATKDPQGNPTNGIIRRATTIEKIGLKLAPDNRRCIFYDELGGSDAWDTEHYLNIYVCSIANNVLGNASFPGGAIPDEDGVIINFSNFGTTGNVVTPNDLGKTLTHELGHYFGLKHIWGAHTGDCAADDGFSDTPAQEYPTQGCPPSKSSCGSPDLFYDYMDYSDDRCLSLFTPQQVAFMKAILAGPRAGLLVQGLCHAKPAGKSLLESMIIENPVSDYLMIRLDQGNVFQAKAVLLDVLGRVVLSQNALFFPGTRTIHVGFLPQGTYYLRIEVPGDAVTKKLVIIP